VGQFITEAEKFQKLDTKVLLVYPGPSKVLQDKAREFSENFTFPDHFYFMLDPDYSMINKYGLRWDAPRETAYPSTFVINKTGEIVYSKISSTHGGRTSAEEILEVLDKL
jgi:peroxiredoxin